VQHLLLGMEFRIPYALISTARTELLALVRSVDDWILMDLYLDGLNSDGSKIEWRRRLDTMKIPCKSRQQMVEIKLKLPRIL